MDSVFHRMVALSGENAGRNFAFPANGTEVQVVQETADLQRILKDPGQAVLKDLTWLSRAIGPSRISENGKQWETRFAITQRHLSRFDRDTVRSTVIDVIDGLKDDADLRDRDTAVGSGLTYRIVFDVLARVFLGISLDEGGLDAALIRRMIRHAAYNTYLPQPNIYTATDAERAEHLAALLNDRKAVFAQLRPLRERCAARSDMVRDLAAAEDTHREILFEQELLTIIAAGTESSASTLGWALFLLGHDPDFQAICAAHADQSLAAGHTDGRGGAGDPIDFLIDETMRRFPGFPFLSRLARVDIPLSDRVLKGGTPFVASLLGHSYRDMFGGDLPLAELHRRSAEVRDDIDPNFAFGGGRRICGGMAFARVELRMVLAALLQRYRVVATSDSPAPVDIFWRLSIAPVGDFHVSLEAKGATAPAAG